MYNDMEIQIHHLEQEAYCAVLRAFKAQADAITWEKEGLITELRKELRVSDDEHRELLSRVNSDGIITRIREWRQSIGHQASMLNQSQAFSSARRKQKILPAIPSMSLGMQPAPLHYHSSALPLPPSLDQGNTPRRRPKRPRMEYSSGAATAAGQLGNHSFAGNIPTETASSNPLIGRRVMTRWPDDNNFYEAVIVEYDPIQGRHALVYDKDTPNESSEWVVLDEIPANDIRWVDEDPSAILTGREITGPAGHRFPPTQVGHGNKLPEDIEIFNTDTLIREVERVFNSSQPDQAEIELAKKMLIEQERALVDAIAMLANASEGEIDDERPFAYGQ